LRIEEYFDAIREIIDESPIVQSARVTYDKRSTYIGFIRGDIFLLDGSQLHFREFVDTALSTYPRILTTSTTASETAL